jgi:hypothetical protein
MRPVPVGLLFAIWIPLGILLGAIAVFAWSQPGSLREIVQAMQHGYGIPGPLPFWAHADSHLHILVTLTATLWLGLGFRLFQPRGLPWLPILLMIGIAMSDEVAQLGSSERSFEWADQAADAIGLALALPLLFVLCRLEVLRAGSGQRERRQ